MWKVTLLAALALVAGAAILSPAHAQPENFTANLSGGEEVPPVATNARGQAVLQLDSSGSALSYRLIVANIHDAVAAHIHCAPAGVNGPVGVTLFSGSPATVNGILAQGTVTAPDPGNACGWTTLSQVVSAMHAGDTYINVHTLEHLPGEIRGQVR